MISFFLYDIGLHHMTYLLFMMVCGKNGERIINICHIDFTSSISICFLSNWISFLAKEKAVIVFVNYHSSS